MPLIHGGFHQVLSESKHSHAGAGPRQYLAPSARSRVQARLPASAAAVRCLFGQAAGLALRSGAML
jgi:hypothetical protein